jgi:cell division protein FtsW
MKSGKIDKPFLISVIILVVAGFFIFSSASLGLLARNNIQYSSIIFNQTFFGLFLGTVCLIITSRIPYKFWRKYSLYLFILGLALSAMVFLPKIGLSHGGAKRWLLIAGHSFQPAEILKFSCIIYIAAWLSGIKDEVKTFKYGFLPFIIILAIVGSVLLNQPDLDTFLIIAASGMAMFITAGAKWRHVLLLVIGAVAAVALMAYMKPYVRSRIDTFLNPSSNSLGSSYQIQQSLIAIGSGRLTGRGFGQSVQKFNYLPEQIGDSIFAVEAEEFGLVGSITLILIYLFFAYRGFKIAGKSADSFGGLLTVGIVILIISQSFNNIASMLGVAPLSGSPLLFVSQGGTALMVTLAEVGIIFNISKYKKSKTA